LGKAAKPSKRRFSTSVVIYDSREPMLFEVFQSFSNARKSRRTVCPKSSAVRVAC
jgi:hypothetical protein